MFLKPLHLRTIDILLSYPESRREMIDRGVSPVEWYLHHDTASIYASGYPQNGAPASTGVRPPKFNFYIERLIFTPRDSLGFIQGWVNDADSPLERVIIRMAGMEVAISASRLIRTLRPELNKKFEVRDKAVFARQQRLGFMGLFRSFDTWSPATQARVEIVCADGASEAAEVPLSTCEQADNIARIEDLLEREETRVGLYDLVEPLSDHIGALGAVAARVKPVLNGREIEFVSYSDGSRVAPRRYPRRATWALLLDEKSGRPNKLDRELQQAACSFTTIRFSLWLRSSCRMGLNPSCPRLSFSRGNMDVDILYIEAETAPVAMLEHVRAAASGDFIVFVDQMCRLPEHGSQRFPCRPRRICAVACSPASRWSPTARSTKAATISKSC